MAITKTNFVEYSRCARYIGLEGIRKDKLDSEMSLEEYKREEEDKDIQELISNMFSSEDGEDIDLTEKIDIQLSAMMGYYKEVELEAARVAKKLFGGKFVYSSDTIHQESFDYIHNGVRYLCYVDIYNEVDDVINIIEVKATTSRNYLELEYFENSKEKYPLFKKVNGIYTLNKCNGGSEKLIKKYNEKIAKLYDRYSDVGKYVYDIAIQRHIIEQDLGREVKINYYLAVLNHNYVYDGYRNNGKRIYNTIDGEDIICFFDMNDITRDYQEKILLIRDEIESNLFEPNSEEINVGKYCAIKDRCSCRYKDICFKCLPKYNTSFNYIGFNDNIGFTEEKYNKYDLVNMGYYKLDDIPYEWISEKQNMIIERECYDNNSIYVDKEKIKRGIDTIEYPIYHLDFESFPCPMPRFKGERPYSQSCFEFSLHIEREPGVCDKDKDNYVFLAETSDDERENMIKELLKRIDVNKGTMLAQNVSFERSRIKELAYIFPEYKNDLLKIVENSTDLMYFIKTNSKLYESLGYDKERASRVNYYHKDLSGSYSIKKTLPVLSDLSYNELEVKNGTEALVTYSLYDTMNEFDLNKAKENLRIYCKQDTWAMVVILDALRKLCQ